MGTKRKDKKELTENVPAKRRQTVPPSRMETGQRNLKELRIRMKKEREWVMEVMDRKRLDDILVDWQPWWENAWVWSGGKQAEEQYEKTVEDKKTKRMERREKLAKKPYYNSLVGFSAFWTRLEMERKRYKRDGKETGQSKE